MRQLLCAACATKKHKVTGVQLLHAGVISGGPDEWERVIWGRARTPDPQQRVRVIGSVGAPQRQQLEAGHYDCDGCDALILPGDRCAAWTVWAEGRWFREGDEPEVWEDRYLERE